MGKNREENALKAVPEPVVLKHECPVKALKVLNDSHDFLVGLENGMIRSID
jgi:hypothetical protein